MAKNKDNYRECEECGGPIESGKPSVHLCKRCANRLQKKRRRNDNRYRPKDYRKKRKKRIEEEEYYEEEYE